MAVRSLPHSWRVALPIAAAIVCMIVARWVPPLAAYVLIMSGVGLIIDGVLAMMPTTGGLWAHRQ